MNWSSWADFAAMGGYALYVWGSFGVCAVAVAAEVGLLALRQRELAAPGANPTDQDSGDSQ